MDPNSNVYQQPPLQQQQQQHHAVVATPHAAPPAMMQPVAAVAAAAYHHPPGMAMAAPMMATAGRAVADSKMPPGDEYEEIREQDQNLNIRLAKTGHGD
mmetsp:Transcript_6865/g.15683  ORF Transcript_6865/g.15683 Transcript_6865/m.15683 type:complete len:99 (-) Transcript_6865:365-661(-)